MGADIGIKQRYIAAACPGLHLDLAVFTEGLQGPAQRLALVIHEVEAGILGHHIVNSDVPRTGGALAGADRDSAVGGGDDTGYGHMRTGADLYGIPGMDLAGHGNASFSGVDGHIDLQRFQGVFTAGGKRRGLTDQDVTGIGGDVNRFGSGDIDHVIDHGIYRHLVADGDITGVGGDCDRTLVTGSVNPGLDQNIAVGRNSDVSGGGKGIQVEYGQIQRPVRRNRASAPVQLLYGHRNVLSVGDLFEFDHGNFAGERFIARPFVHDIVGLGEYPVGDVRTQILHRFPAGLHLVDVVGKGLAVDFGIHPVGLYLPHSVQLHVIAVYIVPFPARPHHQLIFAV